MRVLITGASGMLGTALVAAFACMHHCIGFSRIRPDQTAIDWRTGDMSMPGELASVLDDSRPELVVNAAAMTNVDACERNPTLAQRVNCDAVDELVQYCQRSGGRLVHISTDSVFDGRKETPYVETDPVGPLNVYARTKLGAETKALRHPAAIVLRTNIFGWRQQGGDVSFGEWVLRSLREGTPLTMFHDVMYSPISTPLFAEIVLKCAERPLSGLYHAGGGEDLSKYHFALKVADAYGLATDNIVRISVADKPLAALRPRNMALDSSKLADALGISGMPAVAASIDAWMATESRQGKQ
jgi:dTDP-4-dehydrorhamnose reductase